MATTVELGASAEASAVSLLVREGYRIVERNFRCASGELDIVARDGDALVFVEVRSRADREHGDAVETVGTRKRAQVARVALAYLDERRPRFERSRFDVVAITAGQAELYRDAWRLGLG